MKTFNFLPEGWEKNNFTGTKDIYQGIVQKCDKNYNLHIKLDSGLEGIIPRKEVEAFNVEENGLPKTNLCVGKVHKYVQFKIKEKDGDNYIFSRKDVQKEVLNSVKTDLQEGQVVNGIVKNSTPYGAFVDIGGGIVGLVHIEDISVARIKTPYERFKIGQKIKIMIKSIDRKTNRVILSYKETLGTWEENVKEFEEGMIVSGIAREKEKNKNGIFIELKPNLVGLADYKDNIEYGEDVRLKIKKIIPDKKKIKLTIL